MKRATKKAGPESAAQIAAKGVAQWFAAIAEDPAMLPTPGCDQPDVEGVGNLQDRVFEKLEADYIRAHGPIRESKDDSVRWLLAIDAGYIVGVQVGLRLRIGGAR